MSSTCCIEANENVAHAEVMVRYRREQTAQRNSFNPRSSKVIRTANIKPE